MNDRTPDNPNIRYAHPSHAAFNARLAAQNEPTPRDVLAPWSPSERLPYLRHDFDLLDTYRQTPPYIKEQDNTEQGTSNMVKDDRLAPTYVPPPPIRDAVHKESFGQRWMLEQRNAVMTRAVIPQRGQQHDHTHQQSNHHSGEPPMSNNTQNQHNPNAPLETFKDGAMTIKLWEREHQERKYLNISIGKLYKDGQGQWREGRTMNDHDLLKLQNMIPAAYARIQQIQQQYRDHNQAVQDRLDQAQANEMALQSSAPAQHVPAQQPEQITQQPLNQQDMVAQRDAVMEKAQPAQSQSQPHTQEHVSTPSHEPSR